MSLPTNQQMLALTNSKTLSDRRKTANKLLHNINDVKELKEPILTSWNLVEEYKDTIKFYRNKKKHYAKRNEILDDIINEARDSYIPQFNDYLQGVNNIMNTFNFLKQI